MRKKVSLMCNALKFEVGPSFFEALYFYSINVKLICILLFPFDLNLFQEDSAKILVKLLFIYGQQ